MTDTKLLLIITGALIAGFFIFIIARRSYEKRRSRNFETWLNEQMDNPQWDEEFQKYIKEREKQ